MFDKLIFNIRLRSPDHVRRVAETEHLQWCTEGERGWWQSSALENLTGLSVRITGDRMQVKCSLHKQFTRITGGRLDNTGMFTLSEARACACAMFGRWDTDVGNARVTHFEIGLNLPVSREPMKYIALAGAVGAGKSREMFCDANFEKHRQKTTLKGRTVKKYFKLYDKSHEAEQKHRTCACRVLRAETVYRRQDVTMDVFLSPEYSGRLAETFYRDWTNIVFARRVVAAKGMKASQMERAERIMKVGAERYAREAYENWKDGRLTDKQYRTMREFARDWEKTSSLFTLEADPLEVEYRSALQAEFGKAVR